MSIDNVCLELYYYYYSYIKKMRWSQNCLIDVITILEISICFTGLIPGDFVHVIGEAHVSKTCIKPLREQLQKHPKPFPVSRMNFQQSKIFICWDFLRHIKWQLYHLSDMPNVKKTWIPPYFMRKNYFSVAKFTVLFIQINLVSCRFWILI